MWAIKYGITVVIEIVLCLIVIVIGLLATLVKAIYSILMIVLDLIGDFVMKPLAEWGIRGCPWILEAQEIETMMQSNSENTAGPNYR